MPQEIRATTPARGTESPLAREREEAVEPAGVAVQAQKAVGQNPAFEVGVELAFHEARDGMIAIPSACEKGLEVLAHRLVQQCLFGAARCVLGGESTAVSGLAIVCECRFRHPAEA